MDQIKILLLEDQQLDAELIKRALVKGNIDFELLVVSTKTKFKEALRDYSADIILSDHSLPDFDSHEALEIIRDMGLIIPFILITSTMTDEFAVKVMQAGAHDYIIKDRLLRLPSAVTNLIEKFRLRKEQREERFKSGEDMKYLNHRLLLATKSANIGIWDWNLVTGNLEWDDTLYEMYRINRGQFVSVYDSWLDRLHPEDKAGVNDAMNRAILYGEKYDTQFRILGDNDEVYSIRAAGIVEYDSFDKPIRMIGINWDITARITANRERELIIEDMVQRHSALEQFTYIISHNLRAPIANIIGATGLLTDVDLSMDDRQMLTKGVHDSVVKLDSIVQGLNQILGVKGDIYNHNEKVDFAELVEDIKKSITDVISSNHVVLNYDFPLMKGCFTLKPYMYSIFYNLITNSIKYRQKDVPCIISIKSEKVNQKLELTFTDNGTGINTEKHGANIFGLYKRFHTDVDGKGMGLFMVKTQVEKLGGRISVTSIEKEKTEFKIILEKC
jgi:signal transduction histidine kinase/FixJ family two-component response regulator